MLNGHSYEAVFENDGDQDWFALCAASEGNVNVALTLLEDADECTGFEGEVVDAGGQPIDGGEVYSFDENTTKTIAFNAEAGVRYYVVVDAGNFECQGGRYLLRASGSLARNVPSTAGPPL